MSGKVFLLSSLIVFSLVPLVEAAEPSAERGREALLGRSFNPPVWSWNAYESVWKQWDDEVTSAPSDFAERFRERYGLHQAPYPNKGLPMGLREGNLLVFKGISVDCLVCHGGSIMGKSYVGLGNSSLELQALFDELDQAHGRRGGTPFRFSRTRGTSEAGGMSVYLLGYRNPDLTLRKNRLKLGLRDDLCEDVPAWWLLKKKKTMYFTGGSHADSVRSIMQFMMSPLNGPDDFEREEDTFRDIMAFIKSIEPPPYPFSVNTELASHGEKLFRTNCAKCHGTYGEEPTYPNKIVPIDVIGTDRTRFEGISDTFGIYYNQSWFAKEKSGWFVDDYPARPAIGYQAPPLDGVWATAPYFHNGSVPTIYHVLNSDARPKVYTRSYQTDEEDYDPVKVGWKYREVPAPKPDLPEIEKRKVYDTHLTGRGNQGHTFGDHLTDEERMAIIEYLKTF